MKGKLPARYQSVGLGQEGGIEVRVVVSEQFQHVTRAIRRRLIDDDDLIAWLVFLLEEGGQVFFEFTRLVVDGHDDGESAFVFTHCCLLILCRSYSRWAICDNYTVMP